MADSSISASLPPLVRRTLLSGEDFQVWTYFRIPFTGVVCSQDSSHRKTVLFYLLLILVTITHDVKSLIRWSYLAVLWVSRSAVYMGHEEK